MSDRDLIQAALTELGEWKDTDLAHHLGIAFRDEIVLRFVKDCVDAVLEDVRWQEPDHVSAIVEDDGYFDAVVPTYTWELWTLFVALESWEHPAYRDALARAHPYRSENDTVPRYVLTNYAEEVRGSILKVIEMEVEGLRDDIP